MKKQLIDKIKHNIINGDDSLLKLVINNTQDRVLYQVLSNDFKKLVAPSFIGKKLFVVDTDKATYQFIDELEAILTFNDLCEDNAKITEHIITAGNELEGWQYK